eukprot:gene366-690_t
MAIHLPTPPDQKASLIPEEYRDALIDRFIKNGIPAGEPPEGLRELFVGKLANNDLIHPANFAKYRADVFELGKAFEVYLRMIESGTVGPMFVERFQQDFDCFKLERLAYEKMIYVGRVTLENFKSFLPKFDRLHLTRLAHTTLVRNNRITLENVLQYEAKYGLGTLVQAVCMRLIDNNELHLNNERKFTDRYPQIRLSQYMLRGLRDKHRETEIPQMEADCAYEGVPPFDPPDKTEAGFERLMHRELIVPQNVKEYDADLKKFASLRKKVYSNMISAGMIGPNNVDAHTRELNELRLVRTAYETMIRNGRLTPANINGMRFQLVRTDLLNVAYETMIAYDMITLKTLPEFELELKRCGLMTFAYERLIKRGEIDKEFVIQFENDLEHYGVLELAYETLYLDNGLTDRGLKEDEARVVQQKLRRFGLLHESESVVQQIKSLFPWKQTSAHNRAGNLT